MNVAPQLWERYQRETQREILPAPFRPHPELWDDTGLHAAWLGHSTVLLKIEGTTVITDPVFSDRAGVNLGVGTLGPKRFTQPALRAQEVPKTDVVLLSHAHMDHFDLPSLRAMESAQTSVITAARTSDLLRVPKWKEVRELSWGQEARLGNLTFRGVEVNHWGARVQTDTYRGYNGYIIESPRYRVLFGGDTAMTTAFRGLHSVRGVDLAIMPIGAYNPWIRAHCTPEQALQMAEAANSDFILPIHHQTFELSQEPADEPIQRLRRALGAAPERLALAAIGEEFHHSR